MSRHSNHERIPLTLEPLLRQSLGHLSMHSRLRSFAPPLASRALARGWGSHGITTIAMSLSPSLLSAVSSRPTSSAMARPTSFISRIAVKLSICLFVHLSQIDGERGEMDWTQEKVQRRWQRRRKRNRDKAQEKSRSKSVAKTSPRRRRMA